jgi:hypothetical protein
MYRSDSHPERVTKYTTEENLKNYDSKIIQLLNSYIYPISVKDITEIANKLELNINIFTYDILIDFETKKEEYFFLSNII